MFQKGQSVFQFGWVIVESLSTTFEAVAGEIFVSIFSQCFKFICKITFHSLFGVTKKFVSFQTKSCSVDFAFHKNVIFFVSLSCEDIWLVSEEFWLLEKLEIIALEKILEMLFETLLVVILVEVFSQHQANKINAIIGNNFFIVIFLE